jgi:hypothetical protein
VEYWFGSREQRNRAHAVFSKALKEVKKKSDITVEDGYLFTLLFAGVDYYIRNKKRPQWSFLSSVRCAQHQHLSPVRARGA